MNGKRFYPTPSTVNWYIRDMHIDDMYRVDFQRRRSDQPIWGYDSEYFDFVAKGKQIIVGNIILNYRYPGYLRNAILNQSYNNFDNIQLVEAKLKAEANQHETTRFYQNVDSLEVEDRLKILGGEVMRLNQKNNTQHSVGKTNVLIDRLKSNMRKIYSTHRNDEENTLSTGDANDFFKSILDEKELHFFDLKARYGFQNVSGGYIRVFKDVLIVGESETVNAAAGVGGDMSSSAQPILEVYPFIARQIIINKY